MCAGVKGGLAPSLSSASTGWVGLCFQGSPSQTAAADRDLSPKAHYCYCCDTMKHLDLPPVGSGGKGGVASLARKQL